MVGHSRDPLKIAGVVYKLICTCPEGKIYVGETGRQLEQRIKEHEAAIRLKRTESPWHQHFNNKMKVGDCLSINSTEPLKRKSVFSSDRRLKMLKSGHGKNALIILNQLNIDVQCAVISEGPAHCPIFTVSLEIDNQTFTGRGRTKQMAKRIAAENALAAMKYSEKIHDDDLMNTDVEGKHPVMLLNELHSDLKFNLIKEDKSVPLARFTMSVEVYDITFEGCDRTKKLAKAAAARSALHTLYGINVLKNNVNRVPLPEKYLLPRSIANGICSGIHETFQKVMVGYGDYRKWKVLAGIAMTRDAEMHKIEIIALSTGTKCIVGKNISMDGTSLNDCHAEVLVRRCLKLFLYGHLKLIATGRKNDSIFTECKEMGGYQLKPNVKFHLYVSDPPCGDSRIYLPEKFSRKSLHRTACGVLRSKNKSRNESFLIKGIDGIQKIGPTIKQQTMSCSDKIASWNLLGIQGSLLNYFIQPIYLESIVVGRDVYPGYIFRALWGRFEKSLQTSPEPYHLNKPKIRCVRKPEENCESVEHPDFSVTWSIGFKGPEIINSTTGKLENGKISSLSKKASFRRFNKLYNNIAIAAERQLNRRPKLYSEAKQFALNYQPAKTTLKEAFKNAGLGVWMMKPLHQDDFE
ncbi:double-stranded RNA-specific editase Adar-like [Centruroides vittatus]|uniref:double-stranded RNA-specific editase Adar-like n=1 Tax=Centruroides vittatus TaxID=120091 RepID=UPI00350FFE39